MNIRRALDLTAQMADALADAHASARARLDHGVERDGHPEGHAKILDFGLFAGLSEPPATTRHGGRADRQAARVEALGRSRVGYAAPEQLLGQRADQRSDVFALGTLLYEMVRGSMRSPADAPRRRRQCDSRAAGGAGRPQSRRARAVDRIVMRAMAKNLSSVTRTRWSWPLSFAKRRPTCRVRRPRASRSIAAARRRCGWLSSARCSSPWRAGGVEWRDPLRQAWEARLSTPPDPVLVVLRTTCLRRQPAALLRRGLSEELAQRLARVPGIKVLGQSSIRASAGRPPRPPRQTWARSSRSRHAHAGRR